MYIRRIRTTWLLPASSRKNWPSAQNWVTHPALSSKGSQSNTGNRSAYQSVISCQGLRQASIAKAHATSHFTDGETEASDIAFPCAQNSHWCPFLVAEGHMELRSYWLVLTMSLNASDLPGTVAFRRLAISGEGLSLGAACPQGLQQGFGTE